MKKTNNNLFLSSTKDLVANLSGFYVNWPEGLNQLKGTAERLSRMYAEFCWSPEEIEKALQHSFRLFKNNFDEMLVAKDIHVWALCPHHLLPCEFRVSIGYIPNGEVLGLSKFTRIADILARRPIMQEQYTSELANLLMERLKPKGVGIIVYGKHGCMRARGVKQNSEVVTSVVRGNFLREGSIKNEFLAVCRER